MPKVIGIVGSRSRNSQEDYNKTVRAFNRVYCHGDRIVSGGCAQGGDRFAELIAMEAYPPIEITIHRPDKSKLNTELMQRNPRAAYAVINYARNTLIAYDADILIACVALNRKGGTEDTIKKFKKKLGAHYSVDPVELILV